MAAVAEQSADGRTGGLDLSALFQNPAVVSNLTSMLTQAPPASNFPPFVPIRPVYAPSGYGRQILIYDSRAFPGCRREFAYKTRFTNQSGLTTVYYRCMACRALRHRLQRLMPKEKLPAVPCIAVKNDLLINDPDWPEASDHFCSPLTIEESNNRLKVTFERGFKRARMKMAAEESMKKPNENGQHTPPRANSDAAQTPLTGGIKCEIDESTTSPINLDQWAHWARGLQEAIKHGHEEDDGTTQSTSSNEAKDSETGSSHNAALTNTNTSASAATPTTSPLRLLDDMDMETDNSSPKNKLDALLQLQEQRTMERDKSHSPDENLNNLNLQSFTQKLFDAAPQPDFAALFGLSSATAPTPSAPSSHSSTPTKSRPGSELMKALSRAQHRKREKEAQAAAAAALQEQLNSVQHRAGEYVEQYLKNNWQLPEDGANARQAAELACSLLMALAKKIPQASSALRQGQCTRRDYCGDSLSGKTLAIIGLGKAGIEVAHRMKAFGMKVIGYDPVLGKNEAEKRGIKCKASLDEIWSEADFITLHCPLLPQTAHLIRRDTINRCRPTMKLVNTSRAELVNEVDLLNALEQGRCAGAALDTFNDDPPTTSSQGLLQHPRVIATPSLATVTSDEKMPGSSASLDVFNNPAAASQFFSQLNPSALAAVLDESKVQSVKAATNLGLLLATLAPNPTTVTLKHPASAQGFKKALIAGVIAGVLQAKQQQNVADEGEPLAAFRNDAGLTVNTEQCHGNELTLLAGSASVTGYTSPSGTLISAISGKKVPSPVLAECFMAVGLHEDANLAEELKPKASIEYVLFGGGRIAFFNELSTSEMAQLRALDFVIAKFA